MSEKLCPEKIWIMPETAMELADQPRYISTADYVRGDVHLALEKENAKLREALYHADEGCNYTHMYDEALYNPSGASC